MYKKIPVKDSLNIFKRNQSNFDMKAIEDMFNHGVMFDLITYFMTFDPLSAQIRKLAKYPLTKLSFTGGEKVERFYRDFFDRHMSLSTEGHTFEEIGLETLGFGNSFVSLYIPFIRRFKCEKCGKRFSVSELFDKNETLHVEYYGFEARCPKCDVKSKLHVKDTPDSHSMDKCRIIRWPIRNIDIKYIPFTGERIYFYTVPSEIKEIVSEGKDQDYLNTVPWEMLNAASEDKPLKFFKDSVFHMRCPSINGLSLAWGLPIMMPSMLIAMHIQQLRKANDVAAEERTKARDIIFPAAPNNEGSPTLSLNMRTWGSFMKREQDEHRKDPGRTTYSPLPVGKVTLGGDARAFMVYPEIRQSLEEVAAGMGLPVEFMFGGGHYSGSSVSHRSVEKMLHSYQNDYEHLMNWIIKKLSNTYDLPKTKVKLRKFKMADDLQLFQIYMTLLQNKMLDPKTFYEKTDIADWDSVKENLKQAVKFFNYTTLSEQRVGVDAQVDAARRQMADQAKMQMEMQEQQGGQPAGPGGQQVSPTPEEVLAQMPIEMFRAIQQGQIPPEVQQAIDQGLLSMDIITAIQQGQITEQDFIQNQQAYAGQQGAQAQGQPPEGQQQGPQPSNDVMSLYTPENIQFIINTFGIPDSAINAAMAQGIAPIDLIETYLSQNSGGQQNAVSENTSNIQQNPQPDVQPQAPEGQQQISEQPSFSPYPNEPVFNTTNQEFTPPSSGNALAPDGTPIPPQHPQTTPPQQKPINIQELVDTLLTLAPSERETKLRELAVLDPAAYEQTIRILKNMSEDFLNMSNMPGGEY